MPTLADREDWDEGLASSQEECGGWDEEYDWLDDWEERREETCRGFAEQGQRKDTWGQLQGGPGGAGASSGTRDAGYPFL